jgi:hypothetical protein
VSFSTSNVVFFLIPHPDHHRILLEQSKAVQASRWAVAGTCRTCKSTDGMQILVQHHSLT